MDGDRIEGAAREFGGKVQEAVGGIVGDAATQARGRVNEVAGQAQNALGQAGDAVRGFAAESPVMAMLSALGVGVALGMMLRR